MFKDKEFGAAMLAAPFVWTGFYVWFRPALNLAWPLSNPGAFAWLALVYPVLEEIVFRGGLQSWLLKRAWGVKRVWKITSANAITSVVFAAFHLVYHAPPWALAVAAPSLVFGYFREKYHSVIPPVYLHVFYNAGYFLLFRPT
jgi:hypothetical protein